MSELLIAKSHLPPDAFAVRLREELPEDMRVVIGAQIHGHPLDAIVISQHGLLILYLDVWKRDLLPDATQRSTGRAHRRFSQMLQARQQALTAFLSDEFPTLAPEIRHLALLDDVEDLAGASLDDRLAVAAFDRAPTAIVATPWPTAHTLLPELMQDLLAQALHERRLTTNERASEPFIFRSGGPLGRGRQAWTIGEVIAQLDRHPQDGVFHLRNGTLARWFDEQGATHMVRFCADALQEAAGDYRAGLELFLLRTGIVERPRVTIRPGVLDLGAITAGASATGYLHLHKSRGRGYLVGQLHSMEPWLTLTPDRLVDGMYHGTITVDTTSLPIRADAYATHIVLTSNAAESPVLLPVKFRVTPVNAVATQRLTTLLSHAACTAVVGLLLGWLWATQASPHLGGWLPAMHTGFFAGALGWAAVVGLLWALGGAIHSRNVPGPEREIRSLPRWLRQVAAWATGLFLGTSGYVTLLGAVATSPGFKDSLPPAFAAGLTGAIISIVPALLFKFPALRVAHRDALPAKSTPPPRKAKTLAAGVTTAVAVVVLFCAANWTYIYLEMQRTEGWLTAQVEQVDARLNEWTNQLLLRYHDRRAPALPALAPPVTPPLESGEQTRAAIMPPLRNLR